MYWKPAEPAELEELIPLLIANEDKYISFSSRFQEHFAGGGRKSRNSGFPPLVFVQINGRNGKILNAFMITHSGITLPFFPFFQAVAGSGIELDMRYVKTALFPFKNRLHSVIGLKKDTDIMADFFLKIFQLPPVHSIDYHLMNLRSPDFIPAVNETKEVKVFRAREKDARFLYELEKNYVLEEVIINKSSFNASACLRNLKKTLKHQIVYAARIDDTIAAKAGTNALGFNSAQLGGVFTEKTHRRRNLARLLLTRLLEHIFKTKESVSLFVKKNNTPAVRLYAGLGFRIIDNFNIVYFNNI